MWSVLIYASGDMNYVTMFLTLFIRGGGGQLSFFNFFFTEKVFELGSPSLKAKSLAFIPYTN